MTASDVADLSRVLDGAERLAADCRSILRKRAVLRCDSSKLPLAVMFVKTAHRQALMAFTDAPAAVVSGEPAAVLRS